jgi:hypothetical protein
MLPFGAALFFLGLEMKRMSTSEVLSSSVALERELNLRVKNKDAKFLDKPMTEDRARESARSSLLRSRIADEQSAKAE